MEEEIQGKYLGYLDSIKDLLDDIRAGDVQGIPEQKLAELNELYQQAQDRFTQGIGAFEPFVERGQETIGDGVSSIGTGRDVLSEAADVYRGLGTAPTMEDIQPFINPYQDAVRDEINRAYDIAANEAAAGSVGAGTFGGGREGVLRAELEKNRAGALAQAQAQAFGQGLQNYLASQSASAGGLGNIAGQFGQFGTQLGQLGAGQAGLGFDVQRAGLTDIGTLLDFANLQQQQRQRGFDIDYANQAAGYQQPFTELGFLGSAFGYAPSIPQVASAGGVEASPLQQLAGYGIAGLGALSGFGRGGLFG